MENNGRYLHGRLDPGLESTLQLVEGVEVPDTGSFLSSLEAPSPESSRGENVVVTGIRSFNEATVKLSHLPTELLHQISSYLRPCDLIKLGKTCNVLSKVANTDSLWRHLVQENVPGVELDSPSPCRSFKELYKAHDPHWFLPKNKLWFADVPSFGQLIIAKYDPKTGSILLQRLVAEKEAPQFFYWGDDNKVIVHCFEPRVHLYQWFRRLDLDAYSHRSLSHMGEAERRLKGEVPMPATRGDVSLVRVQVRVLESKFMLARSTGLENSSRRLLKDKWPPPNIPAKSYVDRPTVPDQSSTDRWGRPENRSQINEHSFRVRQWMDMNGQVRIGDEVQTWSTLDAKFYTPTEYSPYQGIFVGDYSGHGTEFLLIDHRDGPFKYDQSDILEQEEDESLEAWEARKKHARIYQGSLRAVKLTGDPNVPRGEITWIADDIGEKGFVRFGEKTWPGARIVKSLGQIANVGFQNPKYIETQLIMISHDLLAQYWEPFGHISFFRRVHIDEFIKPERGGSTV
ncbi:hypothetical protein DSL72_007998 [Monilinia vaccinii-corymbosi]|uniref:F-box domain-containing protein n=1 Tax=Monilinia vaccinii-corymbosi TaxID=61207 RepID=A0A8A3PJD0_9HELO|nr:hypothetical protein DSL72_007998 [Monilinia vaccinii-corymbosi]